MIIFIVAKNGKKARAWKVEHMKKPGLPKGPARYRYKYASSASAIEGMAGLVVFLDGWREHPEKDRILKMVDECLATGWLEGIYP